MTFFRNHKIGKQVVGLRLAVMQLSLEGYQVLETHTKARNEQPSILIDRPYEQCSFQVSQMAAKRIGWCEKWGARIYWHLISDIGSANE